MREKYMEAFYACGDFIILLLLIIILLYIGFLIKTDSKCTDGKEHDWKFTINSKGRTGDLGFGIKASWNVDHYRCTKCGQEKEIEL
jgi:hypothetical protein